MSALAQIGGGMQGITDAFMLTNGMTVIVLGSWLGTIMLFNVWVLIWQNQKKILGLDGKKMTLKSLQVQKNCAASITYQHRFIGSNVTLYGWIRPWDGVLLILVEGERLFVVVPLT